MILLIQLIGYGLILLALIHAIFPKVFDWKNELATLTLINRQLMTVHTFFIALVVFLMGVLCITSAHELLTTDLGKRILGGLAIFWGIRLVTQLFWYSPQLWKGKPRETAIHILFIAIWASITTIFTIGAIS
jgi:hypothetical protein